MKKILLPPFFAFLLLISLSLVTGCGNQNPSSENGEDGLQARGILNGTKDTLGRYKPVVPIILSFDNVKIAGLCTGTVIHSRLVLTAAHCVKGIPFIYVPNSSGKLVLSDRNQVHPQANGVGTPDMAMLRFPSSLGITPMTVGATFPLTYSVNTIVGFGDYGSNFVGTQFVSNKNDFVESGIFQRRSGSVVVSSLQATANPVIAKGLIHLRRKTNQIACQGDSGGPLIVNGQLAGVASYVNGTVIGNVAVCTSVSEATYISTAALKSFIDGAKQYLLSIPTCNPYNLTSSGNLWHSDTTGAYYTNPTTALMGYNAALQYCLNLKPLSPLGIPWYLTTLNLGVINVDANGKGQLVHTSEWKQNDGTTRHVICGSSYAGAWACGD